MLAAATGMSSHAANTRSGAAPSSLSITDAASDGRHRRGVGLQRGERLLRLVGQALGDEADHLADLHQHALHLAQLVGDVLGGADGELGVELGAPLGGRDDPLRPRRRRSGRRCGPSASTSAAIASSCTAATLRRSIAAAAPAPSATGDDRAPSAGRASSVRRVGSRGAAASRRARRVGRRAARRGAARR